MHVWLSYSRTLAAVIAGCQAAWEFFGVFATQDPFPAVSLLNDKDGLRRFITDRSRSRST